MAVLSKCVVGSSLMQIALGQRAKVTDLTMFTKEMYDGLNAANKLEQKTKSNKSGTFTAMTDTQFQQFKLLFSVTDSGPTMSNPIDDVAVCVAISTFKDKEVQTQTDKGNEAFEMYFETFKIQTDNSQEPSTLNDYFENCSAHHLESKVGFKKTQIEKIAKKDGSYEWNMNSFLNVKKIMEFDASKFQTLAGQTRDAVKAAAIEALKGFEKKDLEDCDSEFFALIADDSLEAFNTTGDDTKKISLLKDCFEVMKNKKIKEQAKNDDPKKKDGEEDEEKANPKEVVDTNDIAQPLKDLNDKLPSTWEKRGLWVLLGSSAFTSMATLLIQLHKDHVKAKVDVDEDDEESSDESSD